MAEAKAALAAAVDHTKYHAWKWLGSMFMEPKSNGNGKVVLAASLTRVLTLAMFVAVLVYWYVKPTEVPDSMVQTLWGMLGLKGVTKVAEAIRDRPTA